MSLEESANLVVGTQQGEDNTCPFDHIDNAKIQPCTKLVSTSTQVLDSQPDRSVVGLKVMLKTPEGLIHQMPIVSRKILIGPNETCLGNNLPRHLAALAVEVPNQPSY